MKKVIFRMVLLAAAMMAYCGTSSAQDSDRQRLTREQLAEKQAKYIAGELSMDDATRTRFIETYGRYQKELWSLGPRSTRSQRQKSPSMTDAEADRAIKARFEQSRNILDIRQKYCAEYSEFLTPVQIERIYALERKMMNRLMKQKKNRSR